MHSVAILEPAESWRTWLHATAARTPGATVLLYDSGQALLTSLQWVRPDVIVTSLRLPHVDGFSWLRSLRQNVHGSAARLLVTVAATDHGGLSMARLAGADRVFRKVVDSEALRDELERLSGLQEGDLLLRPLQPLLPQVRQPLFDRHAVPEPLLGDGLKCRLAVFAFLDELVRHHLDLPALYAMPSALAACALVRFAMSCRRVGALRAAHYSELMLASLRDGGLQRSLLGECSQVLADTRRDLVAWLLEWPHNAN